MITIRISKKAKAELKKRGLSPADLFWLGVEQVAPDLADLRRNEGAPPKPKKEKPRHD